MLYSADDYGAGILELLPTRWHQESANTCDQQGHGSCVGSKSHLVDFDRGDFIHWFSSCVYDFVTSLLFRWWFC